jgi:hypothetical protein
MYVDDSVVGFSTLLNCVYRLKCFMAIKNSHLQVYNRVYKNGIPVWTLSQYKPSFIVI